MKFLRVSMCALFCAVTLSATAQPPVIKPARNYCDNKDATTPTTTCVPITPGDKDIRFSVEPAPSDKKVEWGIKEDGKEVPEGKEAILRRDSKESGHFIPLKAGTVILTAKIEGATQALEKEVWVYTLGELQTFTDPQPPPVLRPGETYQLDAIGKFRVEHNSKEASANNALSWSSVDGLGSFAGGHLTIPFNAAPKSYKVQVCCDANAQAKFVIIKVAVNPTRPEPAYDRHAPALTTSFYASFIGGAEQVGLSSLPSQTEPFVRAYFQSGYVKKATFGVTTRLWTSIRLLGAPEQGDTKGIYSVFSDPTGQLIPTKFSSVGASIDFTVGPAFRLVDFADSKNSFDLIVGFGATTPLESNKVTQAYTVPKYGTAECNILTSKFGVQLSNPQYNVKPPMDRSGANESDCLVNGNTGVTANGATTYQAINTLAFSNVNRTSFFLRDMVGLRLNHTVEATAGESCEGDLKCFLGTLDLTLGHDAAITGGAFRGNRLIFRADAIYPVILKDVAAFYVFGSFATRLKRNITDNTPLVLQSAVLSTVAGTGAGSVPNAQTIVLPLAQPDRDFYRIGVGIDFLALSRVSLRASNPALHHQFFCQTSAMG